MSAQRYTGGPLDPNAPENVLQQTASHSWANGIAAVVSLIALAFSAYSLWETSLKQAELKIFVPPVIQFSAPYNNSNFEAVQIPVTVTNEGARTGTVLSFNLDVRNPRTGETKSYYAAAFGMWSPDQARNGGLPPFAPMSIAGNSSEMRTVLFYTRGEDQKPNEHIRSTGGYDFELTLDTAEAATDDGAMTVSARFTRELKRFDARAFNTGTLPLYASDWSTSTSDGQ